MTIEILPTPIPHIYWDNHAIFGYKDIYYQDKLIRLINYYEVYCDLLNIPNDIKYATGVALMNELIDNTITNSPFNLKSNMSYIRKKLIKLTDENLKKSYEKRN